MSSDLEVVRRKLDRKLTAYRNAKVIARANAEAAKVHAQTASSYLRAQEVLTGLAEGVQRQVHDRISAFVTRCLSAVIDDPIEFKVVFETRAGKTTARLAFYEGGEEIDPLLGAGGGAVDVAAFALRLACLLVARPPRRRLLVLDEPFKFVSDRGDYRDRVRDLLAALATELNFQFILVTHDRTFEIGKIIDLG
jgi:hypothetical protein